MIFAKMSLYYFGKCFDDPTRDKDPGNERFRSNAFTYEFEANVFESHKATSS